MPQLFVVVVIIIISAAASTRGLAALRGDGADLLLRSNGHRSVRYILKLPRIMREGRQHIPVGKVAGVLAGRGRRGLAALGSDLALLRNQD